MELWFPCELDGAADRVTNMVQREGKEAVQLAPCHLYMPEFKAHGITMD